MVDNDESRRCGQCPCTNGQVFNGMTFCYFYNMNVYANSLMCYYGKNVADSF